MERTEKVQKPMAGWVPVNPRRMRAEKGESPVMQSEGEAGAKNLLRAQWAALGRKVWGLR